MTRETHRLWGRIVTGLGNGAGFTQLDWARQQFTGKLGIDPHPGTLNLQLDDAEAQAAWATVKAQPGCRIVAPGTASCDARCYRIRIEDHYPAALVYPEVDSYPETQLEIIAPLAIREHLSLTDGDHLAVTTSARLPVEAVLFDIDGTLVDTIETFHILAQRAADPLGIQVSRAAITDSLNTGTLFWEAMLPVDMADREQVAKTLIAEARRLWPEVMKEHGSMFPAVEETLQSLRAQGLRLGIVTGGESLGLLSELQLFDSVVTVHDVKKRKPDPEGLLRCLDELNVKPERALYVGDTEIDVSAAHAAGMPAVGVLSGAATSAILCMAGADRMIASHSELGELIEPL